MKSAPFLLPFLLVACSPGGDGKATDSDASALDVETQAAAAGVVSRVVVLVLDGTRVEESFGYEQTTDSYSDALDGDSEQVMGALRAELLLRGGLVAPAYSTGATITMPSHATLLTGRRLAYGSPATHEGRGAGLYRPELPTFPELLRRASGEPEEAVALVGNTVNLHSLDYSNHPGYGAEHGTVYEMLTKPDSEAPTDSDAEVVDAVQEALAGGARYVVANLHGIDRTAHNTPEDYASAVSDTDGPIVGLWRWIQSAESGMQDETLLVVTADHGRHRFDEYDPVWAGHGDDCSGCREIPMFLIGPGMSAGSTLSLPATHEDLHQTIAWMLGVESPYATGMVLSPLLNLEDAVPVHRSGEAAPAASGEIVAWQRWRDDLSQRTEIVVDGTTFSTPSAFSAEEPVVYQASTGDAFACWRQLELSSADFLPWTLRCVQRQAGSEAWEELGSPVSRLPPDVSPALSEDADGNLVVAFEDLLLGGQIDLSTNSAISVARWQGSSWQLATVRSEEALALHPTLARGDRGLWLAYARGEDERENRYSRHIELQVLERDGDEWSWTMAWRSDEVETAYGRAERPSVWVSGREVQLAYFGYNESGADLVVVSRGDGAWSSPVAVEGAPLSHVRPAWGADGALFWARYGETAAQLCRLWEGETRCTELDTPTVERIAPLGNDAAMVSVQSAGMVWSLETVSF